MSHFVVYTGMNDKCRHQLTVVPFNDKLEYLQSLVGGLIEHYVIDRDLDAQHIDMWIDDEGKFKSDYKPTIALLYNGELYDVIMGNCVFSKYNSEGETLGLNVDEVSVVDRWIRAQKVVGLTMKDGCTVPCIAVDISPH